MDGGDRGGAWLRAEVLGALMPLHVIVGADGRIRSAGPTVSMLCDRPVTGAGFFDLFAMRRPGRPATLSALRDLAGERLHLVLRDPPGTGLSGVAWPVEDGAILVNLSFGIGAAEAVRAHRLTAGDFAPTDLTVELLYLAEAMGAVTGELKAMNARVAAARAAAETQAVTDALTGLTNRRGFETALDRALARSARGGPGLALMHIDLDRFKAINDTYGHAAGDAILAHVAAVLKSELRAGDVAGRMGGDEFVAIVSKPGDAGALVRLGRRIIAAVETPVAIEGGSASVSASIGIAVATCATTEARALLARADAALYAAKDAGRGRVCLDGENSLD